MSGLERRDFLKVVGVGGAGAAAAGCSTDKVERLIPYVVPPEEITPGVATWYASTCGECEGACGIRVRTREGRAVMIEGNPDHPLSRGGLCSRGVAALQGLYNPDRVASPLRATSDGFEPVSWDHALELLAERLGTGGRSVFLTGRKGPAEGHVLDRFAAAVGGRRVVYDPLHDSALREAVGIAFGVNALPSYNIAAADFLVSFGADFLETWLSPVRFAADFAAMHGVDHGAKGKFVFVGPRLSLTGQNADEWIPAKAGSEGRIALAVAGELVRRGGDAGPYSGMVAQHTLEDAARDAGVEVEALSSLADHFSTGSALALGPGLAGHHERALASNLAVLILNAAAGSLGRTLTVSATPEAEASSYGAVVDCVREMGSGAYGVAVVSGTNPAYALPPDAGFRDAFAKVPFKVAFATAIDETAAMADLVLPSAQALESWGDSAATLPASDDGAARSVYSVQQPVMRTVPLFDARPMADVLLETGRRLGHDLGAPTLREYIRSVHPATLPGGAGEGDAALAAEARWREALRAGFLTYGGDAEQVSAMIRPSRAVDFDLPSISGDGHLTLLVHPSPRFGDGSHSNSPWLQELPDPVSKVMWQSWLEMNPATGERMGLRSGDVVRVATGQGEVELRVFLYPGIREDAVGIAMGGGHTDYGRFANGNGVNPMTLLASASDAASGTLSLISTTVTVTPTGAWRRLASTEGSSDQDNRNVAPAVALAALGHGHANGHGGGHNGQHGHGLHELQEAGGFQGVPTEGRAEDFPLPGSDFGEYAQDHPRWAMAVDLDRCNGCGACITACQAENNIPWVGENQALMGREMHWLRMERYYETVDASHSGPLDIRFLPMLCQHCNNAPCEPVCPVFAAYHTPDGLNAQAYNRCVGTRYCANNCPYKVRVFNWYRYTSDPEKGGNIPEPMNWQFNPDVTVRDNGVMEKCTFCVQRIRDAGNRARLEGREVADGEVRTACQSVCPTQVISFGNIKDPKSRTRALAEDERSYRVLDPLINTQPAVHYLKKVVHHEVEEGHH